MEDLKTKLMEAVSTQISRSRMKPGYESIYDGSASGMFEMIAQDVIAAVPKDMEIKLVDGSLTLSRLKPAPTNGLDKFLSWSKATLLQERIPEFNDFLRKAVNNSRGKAFFK